MQQLQTFSAHWLRHRTSPATPAEVAACHSWVRVRLFDLIKGVIKTPMSGGKVNYDDVPVGSSIWVTVTDEGSPMHGRPILITKRPDGQFALEGGSGVSHWHDGGGSNKRVEARRHLVLNVGRTHSTAADRQMAGKLAERDEKKAQYSEAKRTQRLARRHAARQTRQAFNIPADTVFKRAENNRWRDKFAAQAVENGADPQEARIYASAMTRDLNMLTRRFYAYNTAKRAELARQAVGGSALLTLAAGEEPDAEGTLATDAAHEFHYNPEEVLGAIMDAAKEKKEKGQKPLTEAEAEVAANQAGEQQLQAALDAQEPQTAVTDTPPIEDLAGGAQAVAPLPDQREEFGQGDVEGEAGTVGFVDPKDVPAPEPPPPKPVKPNPYVLVAKVDEWSAADPKTAHEALDTFRQEITARANAAQLKEELKEYEGLRLISPTAIDRQALTAAPVGDAEGDQALDDLIEHYRRSAQVPDIGRFYGAIKDHWNDDIPYADGIGAFAEKGAISAITGILGDQNMLDARVDVARIVKDLGIEGAAYALAGDMVKKQGQEQVKTKDGRTVNRVKQIRANLETWNAQNLKPTEERALQRHAELQRQAKLIDEALETGELALEEVPEGEEAPDVKTAPNARVRAIKTKANAEGTRLLADNIYAQRQNLGSALGSMQMAATLLHALDTTIASAEAEDPEAQFVTLFYGDNKEGRDEAMKAFRLKQGSMVGDHDLRMGYALRVDTTAMHGYIKRVQADNVRNLDWESTKTSDKGVAVVGGQEVVPDYHPPLFKTSFTDADGEEKPVTMRRNQRNDIAWLRKAGGGVITRTTGAGKTNTTLGFYAHKIAENPHYHGAVVVPPKRGEQWAKEAANFTNIPTHLIPDNANAKEVDEHLRDYAQKPGGVLLLSHKLAARHADQLQRLYEQGKLHGLTIDEPQEMMGQSKTASLTAGAKNVLKVGQRRDTVPTKAGGERVVATPDAQFNRIALTATPAKKEPVQAYDLVNWTNPKALGPRTRFRNAFEGFGTGTNAADNALARMVGREIAPYVSGDESVHLPFDLKVQEHLVNRSPAQRARQKEIESTSKDELARLTSQQLATLKKNPTNANKRTQDLRKAATEWAKGKLADQHRHNLDSGAMETGADGKDRLLNAEQSAKDNAKVQELLKTVRTSPRGDKHVIFVNGPHQRAVITAALKGEGYTSNHIKQITQGESQKDVEARKAAWKGNKDIPFLMIDRSSASGHNLQEGDHLHVMAAPDEAAQLLQAQGRVARGNKRTDTSIHLYKTHDSPFETRSWEDLDAGMKLQVATSPGLARKFVDRAVKARDAALREYGSGDETAQAEEAKPAREAARAA